MSTWTTTADLDPAALTDDGQAEEVIIATERKVRRALVGASGAPEGGETVIGWVALLDSTAAPDAPHRPHRSMSWTPGEPVPEGTIALSCRGRRTV